MQHCVMWNFSLSDVWLGPYGGEDIKQWLKNIIIKQMAVKSCNCSTKVITPDMREFAEVAQKGEIINLNGAVSMAQSDHVAANTNRSAASSNSSANWKNEEEQAAEYYDTVPF